MAHGWLERRGKVFYLHFSKALQRKPYSLRTDSRTLAAAAQRRIEQDLWLNGQGFKKRVERIHYRDLVQRFVDHKQPSGINPKTLTNYLKTLNHFGRFLQSDPLIDMTENCQTARADAGLPDSMTFHSLRHTVASWLAALGTDFKTLQELIGHKSNEATQIYLQAFDHNKRSAIDNLLLPRKAANA